MSKRSRLRKIMRVPVPDGAVRHDHTSLLQQRGWRCNANQYTGPYATPYGTWHGCIEAAGDTFRCFIWQPPMHVVALHPKSACFSSNNDGWWRVNLARSPVDRDPNAIVLHIERVLIEAHRLAGNT